MLGISDLVKHIKKNCTNLFFLRGFDRLSAGRLEFMAMCAVASRVPEAIQADLMRDNRVAKTTDALWETGAKELKWAIDLPDSTYTLLADLCNSSGSALKDRCIDAAHTSFHFFYRRVLELAWGIAMVSVQGATSGRTSTT